MGGFDRGVRLCSTSRRDCVPEYKTDERPRTSPLLPIKFSFLFCATGKNFLTYVVRLCRGDGCETDL